MTSEWILNLCLSFSSTGPILTLQLPCLLATPQWGGQEDGQLWSLFEKLAGKVSTGHRQAPRQAGECSGKLSSPESFPSHFREYKRWGRRSPVPQLCLLPLSCLKPERPFLHCWGEESWDQGHFSCCVDCFLRKQKIRISRSYQKPFCV